MAPRKRREPSDRSRQVLPVRGSSGLDSRGVAGRSRVAPPRPRHSGQNGRTPGEPGRKTICSAARAKASLPLPARDNRRGFRWRSRGPARQPRQRQRRGATQADLGFGAMSRVPATVHAPRNIGAKRPLRHGLSVSSVRPARISGAQAGPRGGRIWPGSPSQAVSTFLSAGSVLAATPLTGTRGRCPQGTAPCFFSSKILPRGAHRAKRDFRATVHAAR